MAEILIISYRIFLLVPIIQATSETLPQRLPPGVPRSIYDLYNEKIQQELDTRKRNQVNSELKEVKHDASSLPHAYAPGVPHTLYFEESSNTLPEQEEETQNVPGQHDEWSGDDADVQEEHFQDEGEEEGEDDEEGEVAAQHLENGNHDVGAQDEKDKYPPGVPLSNYGHQHDHMKSTAHHNGPSNSAEPNKAEVDINRTINHEHNHTHSILEAGHIMDDEELKHLEKYLLVDTSKMTDKELAFHYFKVHDTDKNQKLDGLELIKFMILSSNPEEEQKIFTDTELAETVENMLKEGDLDRDGYISYAEFRKSYGYD